MRTVESWLLSYLLNSLWQVPVLLAAGWLAARVVRPVGPAAEHRVWAAVLLLQSLVPAFSAASWNWLRGLWTWHAAARQIADGRVAVQFGPGVVSGVSVSNALLTVAAMVYCGFVTYFATRFLWRCVRLAEMRRDSVPVELSGTLADVWTRCEAHFGVHGVSLACSSRLFAPVTIGIRKPIVLLPTAMTIDSAPELLTVTAHEFAHIRRDDFLKNLAYELLSLPVRYHPLFCITRERIMGTREMVCDAMAAEMTGRMNYGRSLLRLASLLVHGMPARTPHAIGIFDANPLERRVMKLKEQHGHISVARRAGLAIACAAFAFAVSASAIALSLHVDTAATSAMGAASKTSAPLEVPAGKMAGNLIHKVTPVYPPEAKKERIQGKVELGATIDKHGKIDHLVVNSGPKELQQSALDAVNQWRYKPYLLNGQPVAVKTTINVTYSLAK